MEMLLEDCWVLGRKVSSCSRLSGIYLFFFFLSSMIKYLEGHLGIGLSASCVIYCNNLLFIIFY